MSHKWFCGPPVILKKDKDMKDSYALLEETRRLTSWKQKGLKSYLKSVIDQAKTWKLIDEIIEENEVFRGVDAAKIKTRFAKLLLKKPLPNITDEELRKRLVKIVAWEALSELTSDFADEERNQFMKDVKRRG